MSGHRQTRNRGTIGGSLAHADPAAELPAVVARPTTPTVRCSRASAACGSVPLRISPPASWPPRSSRTRCIAAVGLPLWPTTGTVTASTNSRRRHGDFALRRRRGALVLDVGAGNRACGQAALCAVRRSPLAGPGRRRRGARLVGQPLTRRWIRLPRAGRGVAGRAGVRSFTPAPAIAAHRGAACSSARALTDAARRARASSVPNVRVAICNVRRERMSKQPTRVTVNGEAVCAAVVESRLHLGRFSAS